MEVKLLLDGDLELRDERGGKWRVGPQHPDYRLHFRSIRIKPRKARMWGAAGVLVGIGLTWLNWHMVVTENYFYPHLIFIGLIALTFGALTVVRPEYAGPPRDDAEKRSRMAVTIPLVTLVTAASGVIWYLLAK